MFTTGWSTKAATAFDWPIKGFQNSPTPAGDPIPTVGPKNLRGNVFTLRHENSKVGLDITPETTIPLWEGEKMDLDMAIEGLLWRESPPDPPNSPGLD